MKMITCKKCGAVFDLEIGECPGCGAIYYVVDNNNESEESPFVVAPTDFTSPPPASDPPPAESPPPRRGEDFPKGRLNIGDPTRIPPPKAPQSPQQNPRVGPAGQRPRDGQRPPPRPPVPEDERYRRPPQQPPRGAPPRRPPEYRDAGRYAPSPGDEREAEDLRRRKWLIVGAIAVVAVLVVVVCALSGVFNFGENKNDVISMPNVVGLTRAEALERLSKAQEELGVQVKYEMQNSNEPRDRVLAQSVREEKTLVKNEVVTLTLSNGMPTEPDTVEPVEVPNLINLTFAEAAAALREVGLEIAKNTEEYSELKEGSIIRQDPAYRSKVEPGHVIYVTISKGVQPTPSPSPSPSPTPAAHTITVTAGPGGNVTPRGAVSVRDGENASFTITPDSGYEIGEVKADGVDVGTVGTYEFTKVEKNHTLYVVFRQIQTPPPTTAPPTTPPPTTPPPTTPPPTTEPPATGVPATSPALPDGNPEE